VSLLILTDAEGEDEIEEVEAVPEPEAARKSISNECFCERFI
jgi:hypothetical protein